MRKIIAYIKRWFMKGYITPKPNYMLEFYCDSILSQLELHSNEVGRIFLLIGITDFKQQRTILDVLETDGHITLTPAVQPKTLLEAHTLQTISITKKGVAFINRTTYVREKKRQELEDALLFSNAQVTSFSNTTKFIAIIASIVTVIISFSALCMQCIDRNKPTVIEQKIDTLIVIQQVQSQPIEKVNN